MVVTVHFRDRNQPEITFYDVKNIDRSGNLMKVINSKEEIEARICEEDVLYTRKIRGEGSV